MSRWFISCNLTSIHLHRLYLHSFLHKNESVRAVQVYYKSINFDIIWKTPFRNNIEEYISKACASKNGTLWN